MPPAVPPMDLNLLVALNALLEERSVSRAAERLHLSVPAMSRTLGRIRGALGDEVLVRAGREMVPTARALELAPRVAALLEEIGAVLARDPAFRPVELRRTFALRADDAIVVAVGEALIARLRREAPDVRLRWLPEGEEDVAPLRTGAIDLDLGVIDRARAAELVVEELFEDRHVGVVAEGVFAGRVTVKRFAAADHVVWSRRGRLDGPIDAALSELGLSRTVVASVGTAAAAMLLAARGRAVTTVPGLAARAGAATLPITAFRIPLDLPTAPYSLAWHPRHTADPAHTWLRTAVREELLTLRPR